MKWSNVVSQSGGVSFSSRPQREVPNPMDARVVIYCNQTPRFPQRLHDGVWAEAGSFGVILAGFVTASESLRPAVAIGIQNASIEGRSVSVSVHPPTPASYFYTHGANVEAEVAVVGGHAAEPAPNLSVTRNAIRALHIALVLYLYLPHDHHYERRAEVS